MKGKRAACALVLLLTGACTGLDRPGGPDDLTVAIYWDASRECAWRYGTISLQRVAPNGDLSVDYAAESTADRSSFLACYHAGIARRVEARRQAGQPVPENFNLRPDVHLPSPGCL